MILNSRNNQCLKTDLAPIRLGRLRCAILGANGYTGIELARLILKHPHAELTACISRRSDWTLKCEVLTAGAKNVPSLSLEQFEKSLSEFEVVFLATPPEISMEYVPKLIDAGLQVIDLSGAFRLEDTDFERLYGLSHLSRRLIPLAQYGLVPWAKIDSSARFISNPGCYATSILMGLIPLVQAELIDLESIVIDSKSGTSGAGLKATEALLFNEVDSDCIPYRVGQHQHLPEITRHLNDFTGKKIDPHFSTSLLPLRRGIISALYLKPCLGSIHSEELLSLIDQAYARAYQNYPLAIFGRLGQSIAQDKLLLSLKKVAGSARTHISYTVKEDKIYLFSLIDNLMKGAASQAIENFNRINGFVVECGLDQIEGQL